MHVARWTSRFLGPILVALLLPALSPAARAVTVSIGPADTTAVCGDTLVVRVVTDAFPDLKAYELVLGYDPAILQCVGVIAGDVLTQGTMQVLPDVVAPVDSVWVDCAQLVGSTSGPGVLAYLRFAALGKGTSTVRVLYADFRDSWNVQTLPARVDGIVRTPYCPTPVMTTTWGRVKTLYR